MLADMLGFTRHERLDVKKPGPPAAPPPLEVAAEKKSIVKEGNKEVLPAHLNSDNTPKIKKVVREHSEDDHGPHSVDPEYTHVIFKAP